MRALSLINRHKERSVRGAGEESREPQTCGEREAQGRERQAEPSQKVTKSWVGGKRMGLTVGRGMPALTSFLIHN